MVKRKLKALDYHSADTFQINDFQQFKACVLWLEDQVIRHYKIEDRSGLRDLDSDKWLDSYRKYCADLECPIPCDNKPESLEWIAGYAVRLAYLDDKEKYTNKLNSGTTSLANPLDGLDFHSNEFKTGVNGLAKILKVTPHPDHLVTLDALCTLIAESMDETQANNNSKKGSPFPMQADLRFDLGDKVLNQAGKVLRLLYVHDLRDLQTKINECIVSIQAITANPKTNTKLGKVGF